MGYETKQHKRVPYGLDMGFNMVPMWVSPTKYLAVALEGQISSHSIPFLSIPLWRLVRSFPYFPCFYPSCRSPFEPFPPPFLNYSQKFDS